MTETQQRFLRSIAERVPLEHVVELHLFPPIRQGGVETGVAVVAEDPRRSSPLATPPSDPAEPSPETDALPAADASADAPSLGDETTPAFEPDAESAAPPDAELMDDTSEPAPAASNGSHASSPRYTIHTARYRLTLKGVDRGKWEVDVVAEADAPLEAVDAVVRGVQRRAGEGAEPDRLSTEALRDALELTPAQLDR